MIFKIVQISKLIGIFFVLVSLLSCEENLDTLGVGVIDSEPFTTNKAAFDVFAYSRSVEAVQTDRLPLYQLGVYNDPVYGKREAIITSQILFNQASDSLFFGNLTQNTEGQSNIENETVKEVILYIPYQMVPSSTNDSDGDGVPDDLESLEDRNNPNSDQDGDGLTDLDERTRGTDPFNPDTDGDGTGDAQDSDTQKNTFANTFALDSIFSSRFVGSNQNAYIGETFNFKVEQSTFFLRDLDPNTNFQERQQYFSNTDLPTFIAASDALFDDEYTIDNKEIVTFNEDDPNTDDDESKVVASRLNPGIQVSLDTQFFQENILDKEGSFELLNQSNFSEFIRGLHFTLTPSVDDLMILLNLTQANITIRYEFDDTSKMEKAEKTITLNFLQGLNNIITGGHAVNTFINDPMPVEIANQLDQSDTNASRIYLKGGSGSFAELRLFDNDETVANEIIESIRDNNWVINEANLSFYVDRELLDALGGTIEPPRLYVYRSDTNQPLYNRATEVSSSEDPLGRFLNYDGILQRDSNGNGIKYSIRITDYINDIIVRDSINAPLRLALTSNIEIATTQEAQGNMGAIVDLPLMNTINPLGTVLFGNNVPIEENDKKLKLEIFYTEID